MPGLDDADPRSGEYAQSGISNPFKDVSGHGSARGEMIRITLDSRGEVQSVRLAPKIRRLAPGDIAESVRQALLAAQQDWRRQVATISTTLDAENRRVERRLAEIDALYVKRIEQHRRTMDELRRRLLGPD